MNLEEKPNFLNLMTNIAGLYKEKFSVARLEIYWRCLQHYSIETLQKALDAHALHPDQGQFMPKPADITRLIEGNHATKALQAFNKVRKAIEQVGGSSSIVFDDPIIHVVIEQMGGWITLCKLADKEFSFKARDFEKLYTRYVDQKPPRYLRQLIGITQGTNMHNGYFTDTPILFGNEALARKVYEGGEKGNASLEYQKTPLLLNYTEENKS